MSDTTGARADMTPLEIGLSELERIVGQGKSFSFAAPQAIAAAVQAQREADARIADKRAEAVTDHGPVWGAYASACQTIAAAIRSQTDAHAGEPVSDSYKFKARQSGDTNAG